MRAALSTFDKALPNLKAFRDVAEHFDDYAVDLGRNRAIRRSSLEVSSIEGDGPALVWLGYSLNASVALRAAEVLFKELQDCVAYVPRDA